MPDTGPRPPGARPKPRPRIVEVARSVQLTPHMRRVTFTGPDLAGWPTDRDGGNIKLFFPEEGWTPADLVAELDAGRRPTVRTYTARRYKAQTSELDVDFVIHPDGGPASRWAAFSKPGDFLGLAGPSGKKFLAFDCDWFLVCADMSAMPAACATLEDLPANARGAVFFEVPSCADEMPIDAPEGMAITWLLHKDPQRPSTVQLDAVKRLRWAPGRVGAFVAGESGAVRALRSYLLEEKQIDRASAYFSGYWMIGLVEDEHQIEKRREAAAAAE